MIYIFCPYRTALLWRRCMQQHCDVQCWSACSNGELLSAAAQLIVWHKADTTDTDALTCLFTDIQQWPSAITNRLTKEHSFIHGPGGSLIWDVDRKWNTKQDQVWTVEDQGTCCLNWHYHKENILAPLIISVLRAIYTKSCLRNTSIGPNLKLTK